MSRKFSPFRIGLLLFSLPVSSFDFGSWASGLSKVIASFKATRSFTALSQYREGLTDLEAFFSDWQLARVAPDISAIVLILPLLTLL